MNERQTSCKRIGHIEDNQGNVLAGEMEIVRGGIRYRINVATEGFAASVRHQNIKLPIELQAEDNYFVMNDVSTEASVCFSLSKEPMKKLAPYLIRIDPDVKTTIKLGGDENEA